MFLRKRIMNDDQSSKNKLIKFLKKVIPLIGIIIFIYLIIDIGPDKISSTFLEISPHVLILFAVIMVPRILLNNYMWQLILKKQKIRISFVKSLKILMIGHFYGHITPSRLGTYVKVFYLREETEEPIGKLFVNVFVKIALDLLALYLLMIITAFIIVEQYPEIFFAVLVYVSIVSFLFFYFIKKERGEKTINLLIKYFIPKKLKSYLSRFTDTFYKDFPITRYFIFPFVLSLFIQIIFFIQMYIIALSLGIEIPFHIFIVIYTIAGCIATIPISIAGLGTREATLVLLFTPFGIAAQKVVVLSLAGYILSVLLMAVPGLIIALLYAKNNNKLLKLKGLENIPKN